MHFYKKPLEDGKYCLFQSPREPMNKEGLIEISEEEYNTLFEQLLEEVE